MIDSYISSQKIKLNDSEQELFDAILDEYNDIFEYILIIGEKNLFDKIIENVKAILGPKKISYFSKMSIPRVLSYLKLSNYLPDIMSLKQIKEAMISLGNSKSVGKMPPLRIDDIFSHCKECSKCYHICGEVLLNPSEFDFIICLKCKMVYKKELIHLYCKECDEEYYSYIIDDSEPEFGDYYPATWEKYHCPNFIYEEMTCPECDSMIYYNENENLLKCFDCRWKCLANEKKWVCEICDEEFKSGVKEYIRFETRPMVNCVRDALVQQILARPSEMVCCNENPRYFSFIHEEKGCKGILYLGKLQKKDMVVCSECRLVQYLQDVIWTCPNCKEKFICKKIENNFEKNKNCIIIKQKSLKKTDTAGLFKPKKIFNFPKKDKSNEKASNINSFRKNSKKTNGLEKFVISDNLKLAIKTSVNKSNEKITKNINKEEKANKLKEKSDSKKKNYSSKNSKDNEKSSSSYEKDVEAKAKQGKSKKVITSFYKKPKNYLSNNKNLAKEKEKLKEKSKEENKKKYFIEENDNISSDETKTPNKINLKLTRNEKLNFYSRKKEISLNQSINLSLREMKLLSLKNQKYINKSKIKFDKSFNETNTSSKNKNIYSENKIKNIKISNKEKEKADKKINLNLNLNININNYLSRSRSIKSYHTLENNLINKSISKSYLNLKNINSLNNKIKIEEIEPNENFIPEDFKTIKQIGEGSFGKIYCSQWKKNKKNYAMKKMILRNKIEIKKNQEQTDLVFDLLNKTNIKGIIKVYGSQCIKVNNAEYHFYVLMELAEIDWEKEIKKRKDNKKFYTEGELFEILKQLTTTFSLLQKNNITHRDIKPQNILVYKKVYKVCDFGEAKVTDGEDIIHQTIKGTELYMSPILFRALNKHKTHIIHNTYKSDVFSLGMCVFLAATLTFQSLYDIRELKDMELIKNILVKYLIAKYSYDFVHILIKMLEFNEELRPDFIELEKIISKK